MCPLFRSVSRAKVSRMSWAIKTKWLLNTRSVVSVKSLKEQKYKETNMGSDIEQIMREPEDYYVQDTLRNS